MQTSNANAITKKNSRQKRCLSSMNWRCYSVYNEMSRQKLRLVNLSFHWWTIEWQRHFSQLQLNEKSCPNYSIWTCQKLLCKFFSVIFTSLSLSLSMNTQRRQFSHSSEMHSFMLYHIYVLEPQLRKLPAFYLGVWECECSVWHHLNGLPWRSTKCVKD